MAATSKAKELAQPSLQQLSGCTRTSNASNLRATLSSLAMSISKSGGVTQSTRQQSTPNGFGGHVGISRMDDLLHLGENGSTLSSDGLSSTLASTVITSRRTSQTAAMGRVPPIRAPSAFGAKSTAASGSRELPQRVDNALHRPARFLTLRPESQAPCPLSPL